MAEGETQQLASRDALAAGVEDLHVSCAADSQPCANAAAAAGAAGMPPDDKPLPALFLDTMPDDQEAHPDLAAMNTMMGELTPDEHAENGRVRQPIVTLGGQRAVASLCCTASHVTEETLLGEQTLSFWAAAWLVLDADEH